MNITNISEIEASVSVSFSFKKDCQMIYYGNELYHHGVLGQKWGVRRYQNYDGTRIKQKYDPPYSKNEIIKNYGYEMYKKLSKDPAHKYRMDSGIELIHEEPSYKELERIHKNWNLMSDEQKQQSDKISKKLFGCTNEQHYKQLMASNKYKFERAEEQVQNSLSLKPKPIIKSYINLETVQKRGNLTPNEAFECSRLANTMFDKSKKAEPKITNDVIDAVKKSSAKMYGLKYRLKQPNSLAAKIGADAKEKDIDFENAANKINDTIRYTTVSLEKDFVKNYNILKESLESKGYTEIKCKNFFEKYRNGEVQHKSVQSIFQSPSDYPFEIQFHTPASQAAKELKIPIYEERRKTGNTESRNHELEQQMHELAEQVSYPQNISYIKSRN